VSVVLVSITFVRIVHMSGFIPVVFVSITLVRFVCHHYSIPFLARCVG
jgi:hypothetical protein